MSDEKVRARAQEYDGIDAKPDDGKRKKRIFDELTHREKLRPRRRLAGEGGKILKTNLERVRAPCNLGAGQSGGIKVIGGHDADGRRRVRRVGRGYKDLRGEL